MRVLERNVSLEGEVNEEDGEEDREAWLLKEIGLPQVWVAKEIICNIISSF